MLTSATLAKAIDQSALRPELMRELRAQLGE
jgi:hypothetical protein